MFTNKYFTKIAFKKGYRHFSNSMHPLFNAEKLFYQMKTNLFPLNISTGTILPISNFLLIQYGAGQSFL